MRRALSLVRVSKSYWADRHHEAARVTPPVSHTAAARIDVLSNGTFDAARPITMLMGLVQ